MGERRCTWYGLVIYALAIIGAIFGVVMICKEYLSRAKILEGHRKDIKDVKEKLYCPNTYLKEFRDFKGDLQVSPTPDREYIVLDTNKKLHIISHSGIERLTYETNAKKFVYSDDMIITAECDSSECSIVERGVTFNYATKKRVSRSGSFTVLEAENKLGKFLVFGNVQGEAECDSEAQCEDLNSDSQSYTVYHREIDGNYKSYPTNGVEIKAIGYKDDNKYYLIGNTQILLLTVNVGVSKVGNMESTEITTGTLAGDVIFAWAVERTAIKLYSYQLINRNVRSSIIRSDSIVTNPCYSNTEDGARPSNTIVCATKCKNDMYLYINEFNSDLNSKLFNKRNISKTEDAYFFKTFRNTFILDYRDYKNRDVIYEYNYNGQRNGIDRHSREYNSKIKYINMPESSYEFLIMLSSGSTYKFLRTPIRDAISNYTSYCSLPL